MENCGTDHVNISIHMLLKIHQLIGRAIKVKEEITERKSKISYEIGSVFNPFAAKFSRDNVQRMKYNVTICDSFSVTVFPSCSMLPFLPPFKVIPGS